MSIRIEVTGTSIGEVADKLLAIGHSLRATPEYKHTEIKGNITFTPDHPDFERLKEEAEKPKAKAPRKKAEPEVAEEAPVDPTPAPEETAGHVEPEPAAETIDTNSSATTATSSPSEPELDFEKDVAPVVIDAVSRVGREGVSSTLAEFGAERASEVDPSQYAELVAALEAL